MNPRPLLSLACLISLLLFSCQTILGGEGSEPTEESEGGDGDFTSGDGDGDDLGIVDDPNAPTGGSSGDGDGAGTGGEAGPTTGVPASYPRGMSAGCGKQPPSGSVPGGEPFAFVMDTPPDQGWIEEFNGSEENYLNRTYRVKLPPSYDPNVPFTVNIVGGGCGGSEDNYGGLEAWDDNGDHDVIHVHPAYENGCYLDDGVNNPEVVFMKSWWPEFIDNYCVDLERVFISGWSSGSWEAVSMGCAFSGTIRGHGSSAGGLRQRRGECVGPVAGFIGGDLTDGANPIHDTVEDSSCTGTEAEGCWLGKSICTGDFATRDMYPNTDPRSCVDEGTAKVRDSLLERNGCIGKETEPWGGTLDNVPVESGGIYRYPTFMHTAPGEALEPASIQRVADFFEVSTGDALSTLAQYFPVPGDNINNLPACHKYTGCPDEFPVVFCMTYDDGHSPLSRITEHNAPDDGRRGIARFFEDDVPRYPAP